MGTYTKLDLVIKAIEDAKEITPKGQLVIVYLENNEKLRGIYPQELKTMLLKLQDDEKILRIESFPEWLLPSRLTHEKADQRILAAMDSSKNNFMVDILNGFDKWYVNYRKNREETAAGIQQHRWQTTRTPLPIQKIIWKKSVAGESPARIQSFFELHARERKYKNAPMSTKTIKKDIGDFSRMPGALRECIVAEIPELQSLVDKK